MGLKTIFGKRGRFDWEDACRLCLEHPRHRSFLVLKLWSYFIPTPPSALPRPPCSGSTCGAATTSSRCWQAILKHPAFYNGPRMVKPPIVLVAGMLRAKGRGVDSTPGRGSAMAGQHLFQPPNVAGWDESRWLDTATFRGRWWLANYALERFTKDPDEDAAPSR